LSLLKLFDITLFLIKCNNSIKRLGGFLFIMSKLIIFVEQSLEHVIEKELLNSSIHDTRKIVGNGEKGVLALSQLALSPEILEDGSHVILAVHGSKDGCDMVDDVDPDDLAPGEPPEVVGMDFVVVLNNILSGDFNKKISIHVISCCSGTFFKPCVDFFEEQKAKNLSLFFYADEYPIRGFKVKQIFNTITENILSNIPFPLQAINMAYKAYQIPGTIHFAQMPIDGTNHENDTIFTSSSAIDPHDIVNAASCRMRDITEFMQAINIFLKGAYSFDPKGAEYNPDNFGYAVNAILGGASEAYDIKIPYHILIDSEQESFLKIPSQDDQSLYEKIEAVIDYLYELVENAQITKSEYDVLAYLSIMWPRNPSKDKEIIEQQFEKQRLFVPGAEPHYDRVKLDDKAFKILMKHGMNLDESILSGSILSQFAHTLLESEFAMFLEQYKISDDNHIIHAQIQSEPSPETSDVIGETSSD
jgi:hypothetical protein